MKPVIFHCEANVELTAAAKRYQCERPELARDFLRAFRAAKDALEKQPDRFSFLEKPVRRARVADFPPALFMTSSKNAFMCLRLCTTAASGVIGKPD